MEATTTALGITAGIEMIGPAEADAILAASDVPNRNIRGRVVAGYAAEMVTGRWLVTGESIKIDRDGGLIDGQHRLTAIVVSGVTLPVLVVRGLDRSVIRVIDTAVRRSAADSLRFAGIDIVAPVACASVARLAVARENGGLNTYGRVQTAVSHLAIVEWVEQHQASVEASVQFGYRARSRIGGIAPSPLAYAHHVLTDLDAIQAAEFFEGLMGLDVQSQKDPRAVLFRAFMSDEHRSNPGAIIGRTFTAWNAWRDHQTIRALPAIDSKGRPLRIPDPV